MSEHEHSAAGARQVMSVSAPVERDQRTEEIARDGLETLFETQFWPAIFRAAEQGKDHAYFVESSVGPVHEATYRLMAGFLQERGFVAAYHSFRWMMANHLSLTVNW